MHIKNNIFSLAYPNKEESHTSESDTLESESESEAKPAGVKIKAYPGMGASSSLKRKLEQDARPEAEPADAKRIKAYPGMSASLSLRRKLEQEAGYVGPAHPLDPDDPNAFKLEFGPGEYKFGGGERINPSFVNVELLKPNGQTEMQTWRGAGQELLPPGGLAGGTGRSSSRNERLDRSSSRNGHQSASSSRRPSSSSRPSSRNGHQSTSSGQPSSSSRRSSRNGYRPANNGQPSLDYANPNAFQNWIVATAREDISTTDGTFVAARREYWVNRLTGETTLETPGRREHDWVERTLTHGLLIYDK